MANFGKSSLRVSGIYADGTTSDQSMPFKDAFSNRKNEILTSQGRGPGNRGGGHPAGRAVHALQPAGVI
ncbi:hypothetical protein AB656_03325 [Bifidobacterium actinocoloniiforme DSM 22766]|nr:hypothetical protein AB656_03325 [Bifidobacterium actinocoloniiforme DSM 22766]